MEQAESSSEVAERAEPTKESVDAAAAEWLTEERLERFAECLERAPALWRAVHSMRCKEKSSRGFAYARLLSALGVSGAPGVSGVSGALGEAGEMERGMALCRVFMRLLRQKLRWAAAAALARARGPAAARARLPRWALRADAFLRLLPRTFTHCKPKAKNRAAPPASDSCDQIVLGSPAAPGEAVGEVAVDAALGGAAGARLMRRVVRGVRRAGAGAEGAGEGGLRDVVVAVARRLGDSERHISALWNSMRALMQYKLRQHLARGDRRDAGPAGLSALDWAVADVLLFHGCSLLDQRAYQRYESLEALLRTFHLVQRFELEPEPGRQVAPRLWLAAARWYSRDRWQLSGLALQRRWHELKLDARRRVRAHAPAGARAPPLLPLLHAVARRYPHVVTAPLPSWEELARAGLLAPPSSERGPAPGELWRGARADSSTDSANEVDDEDLIIVEKDIETIDVSEDEAGAGEVRAGGEARARGKAPGGAASRSHSEDALDGEPQPEPGIEYHCNDLETGNSNSYQSNENTEENGNKEIVDADTSSPKTDVLEALQALDVCNIKTTIFFDSDEENGKCKIAEVVADVDTKTAVNKDCRNAGENEISDMAYSNECDNPNNVGKTGDHYDGKVVAKFKTENSLVNDTNFGGNASLIQNEEHVVDTAMSNDSISVKMEYSQVRNLASMENSSVDIKNVNATNEPYISIKSNAEERQRSDSSDSDEGNLVIDHDDEVYNENDCSNSTESNSLTHADSLAQLRDKIRQEIEEEMFFDKPTTSKIKENLVVSNATNNPKNKSNDQEQAHIKKRSPHSKPKPATSLPKKCTNKDDIHLQMNTTAKYPMLSQMLQTACIFDDLDPLNNSVASDKLQYNRIWKIHVNKNEHIKEQPSVSGQRKRKRPTVSVKSLVTAARTKQNGNEIVNVIDVSDNSNDADVNMTRDGSVGEASADDEPMEGGIDPQLLMYPVVVLTRIEDDRSLRISFSRRSPSPIQSLSPYQSPSPRQSPSPWQSPYPLRSPTSSRSPSPLLSPRKPQSSHASFHHFDTSMTPQFVLSKRNIELLKLCKPCSVVLKRLEPGVIAAAEKGASRVAKKVELPDIEQVRRNNRSMLTAQVAPLTQSQSEESGSAESGAEAAAPQTADELRQLLDRIAATSDGAVRCSSPGEQGLPSPACAGAGAGCARCAARLLAAPARSPRLASLQRRLLRRAARDARHRSAPVPPAPATAKRKEKKKPKKHKAKKRRRQSPPPPPTPSPPPHDPESDAREWLRQKNIVAEKFGVKPRCLKRPAPAPAPAPTPDPAPAPSPTPIFNPTAVADINRRLGALADAPEPFTPLITGVRSLAGDRAPPTITLRRAEPVFASTLTGQNLDPAQKYLIIPSPATALNYQEGVPVSSQGFTVRPAAEPQQLLPQVVDVAGGVRLGRQDQVGLHLVVSQGLPAQGGGPTLKNFVVAGNILPNQAQPSQQGVLNQGNGSLLITPMSGADRPPVSLGNSMLVSPVTMGGSQPDWIFSSVPGGPQRALPLLVRSVQAGPGPAAEPGPAGPGPAAEPGPAEPTPYPVRRPPARPSPAREADACEEDSDDCPEQAPRLDWRALPAPAGRWARGRDPARLAALCTAPGPGWALAGRFLLLSEAEPPPPQGAVWALRPRVRLTLPDYEPDLNAGLQKIAPKPEPAKAKPWLKVKSFARIDFDREADRAEPTQAEPTQAEQTQAEPTQAEQTQAEPTQAEQTQAEPVKTTAPARVYLNDTVYQKLCNDPLIYAKLLVAVRDSHATRALLVRGAPLQLYCLRSCRLFPLHAEPKADVSRITLSGDEEVTPALMELARVLYQLPDRSAPARAPAPAPYHAPTAAERARVDEQRVQEGRLVLQRALTGPWPAAPPDPPGPGPDPPDPPRPALEPPDPPKPVFKLAKPVPKCLQASRRWAGQRPRVLNSVAEPQVAPESALQVVPAAPQARTYRLLLPAGPAPAPDPAPAPTAPAPDEAPATLVKASVGGGVITISYTTRGSAAPGGGGGEPPPAAAGVIDLLSSDED